MDALTSFEYVKHSRRELDYLLCLVPEVEARVLGKPPRVARAFRHVGSWLLAEDHLQALRRRSPEAAANPVPGLPRPGGIEMLANALARRPFMIHSRASAIRIRKNLRLFYPRAGPATIQLGSPEIAGAFAHSNSLRIAFDQAPSLMTPRRLDSGEIGGRGYLCEEMFTGRQFDGKRDWSRFEACYLPDMLSAYHGQSLTALPIYDIASPQDDMAGVCHYLSNAGFNVGALRKVLERDDSRTFCATAGHGDLCVSNFVISSTDKLCVVDWESAKSAYPLMFEWAKILIERPELEPKVAAFMVGISGKFSGYETQLLIATIRVMNTKIQQSAKRRLRRKDRSLLSNGLSLVNSALSHVD